MPLHLSSVYGCKDTNNNMSCKKLGLLFVFLTRAAHDGRKNAAIPSNKHAAPPQDNRLFIYFATEHPTRNTMSKSIDSNKQFMIGNGLLAFGVFFIVSLFFYLGFRYQRKDGQPQAFEGQYTLQLTPALAGDSLAVYINDSLIVCHTFDASETKVQVRRFAEESMLMVVDQRTEDVTPFNLHPKGSLVSIGKKGGRIFIEEKAAVR